MELQRGCSPTLLQTFVFQTNDKTNLLFQVAKSESFATAACHRKTVFSSFKIACLMFLHAKKLNSQGRWSAPPLCSGGTHMPDS